VSAIPEFHGVAVAVVGDVMLDRYWYGDTARISPEAPVPVVRVGRREDRAGGAANVALNLAALGVTVSLAGMVGRDEAGQALVELLRAHAIAANLMSSASLATITKLRVISRSQQLIRLDFETGAEDFAAEIDAEAAGRYALGAASAADVVVLSDYGKGTLSGAGALCRELRAQGKRVLVDPKGADWSRYRGASLITPNVAELEAVVGACRDEATLVSRTQQLMRNLEVDAILVTRSEQGMTLIEGEREPVHLPARAREVFDVTGAGDTVIALLAAGAAAGLDWAAAARLANLGAGIVVGKLGTASVSVAELQRAVRMQEAHAARGMVDEPTLLALVREARAHGESVVMTNGCFDLLHPGHVGYLEAARRLGDRLIVAVNDDASVRRLKGCHRPLNPLAHRMRVLSGLAAVDWVVPFSQDTPESLICRVLPDVLVKGGDYRAQDVAGARCVIDHGGRVEILDYDPAYSTTRIIASARQPRSRG